VTEVVSQAAELYGYSPSQVEMRLYVGKFAGGHEEAIRRHLAGFTHPPVRVVGLPEIADSLVATTERRTYTDDAVIMTVRALRAAGRLDQA
jgi:hypothetical protein